MKFLAPLTLAIVCLASSAFALDTTYLKSVKAHETAQFRLDLPAGKSVVEVFGTDDETISCTFIDRSNGNIAYDSRNVKRCYGTANLPLPASLNAKVSSAGDKDMEFHVWVHE